MEPLGRRALFCRAATLAGSTWLGPLAKHLAQAAESDRTGAPARSVIVLWLAGGPSQLETFDPHPGSRIAGGTRHIPTAVKDIFLAEGLERVAEQMGSISLIRSMMSREGDHERGTYNLKTGFRPDPTVTHPSLGSVACRELPVESCEIPRHVSILHSQWPGRGGYLGDAFDAFLTGDPLGPVPDTRSYLVPARDQARVNHLGALDRSFGKGREKRVEETLHRETMRSALRMMTSEQLKAFDVSLEPLAIRRMYGETPFGRGCLAARRLIETGVRCVEVNLAGWDTHANNHQLVANNLKVLDPAFAGLVRDLRERGLLGRTIVICMGEFGRTPAINPAGGRDHWPGGFSIAVAGGGIRGGRVVGETDPEGKKEPASQVQVGGLFATIFTALGIDYQKVNQTPIGRTVRFSEGMPLESLLGRNG
ncbi:MAG: DUF1501 domain-containing protein [Planctomycetes bacterium]|nr:DUF1501 domain-containing protein [Planctomycetota bacterium]